MLINVNLIICIRVVTFIRRQTEAAKEGDRAKAVVGYCHGMNCSFGSVCCRRRHSTVDGNMWKKKKKSG